MFVKGCIDDRTDDFLGCSQRDAHEFLRSILHFMHEDMEIQPEESFTKKRPE